MTSQQPPIDDWETEIDNSADQQQQNLSQQTSRLRISSAQAPAFRPQASTFIPGAQPFYNPVPQSQQQQQYYGGYGEQQAYGAPSGYGYQQPGYYPAQQYPYVSGYGEYHQQQFQPEILQRDGQSFNPTSQQQYVPHVAKPPPTSVPRPTNEPPAQKATKDSTSQRIVAPSGPAKVLKIGGSSNPSSVKEKEKDTETTSVKKEPAPLSKKDVTQTKKETQQASGPKSSSTLASKSTSDKDSKAPSVNGESRSADVVIKEQEEEIDDTLVEDMYGKEHVNIVFIGHVDAGKSTLGGNILFLTGMVDERTMEKYEKEAKEAGRESWYLSWALDSTKEERAKGKTVEVGRARFETEKRRYTILDAPGHKSFVPNMISGAAQADVGVLVISARKGEYETGFERGGQTREHAVLAKMQGINKLVVVINKMDDATVEWSKERYDECIKKLGIFLKGNGFNPKTDLFFLPISAYKGQNLLHRVSKDICPWYEGPSLLEFLDSMQSLERKVKAPLMMPIGGKYKDMGTTIEGKIESGSVRKGATNLIMPNKHEVEITGVFTEADEELSIASSGDQVRLRIKGVEEEEISIGFVLCSLKTPVHVVSVFEAQVAIIELKSLLTTGYSCVMHVHTAVGEVTFSALLHKLNKQNQRSKKAPLYATKGQKIVARLESNSPICLERFEDHPMLGRFTLRDQATTVAIGKVTKLILE